MKVLHVISSISRDCGGPARSSQGFVAALNQSGVEAWLLCCSNGNEPWLIGKDRFREARSSCADDVRAALELAIAELCPDLIHIHGIWRLYAHLAAKIARKRKIPYVVAPRGMLEPAALKQKWLKKKCALWIYQGYDLRRAVALHATAKNEAEQCYSLGFNQKIFIAPNGVNVPQRIPLRRSDEMNMKRVLLVSRMHPHKGIIELVDAWDRVRPSDWQCELVYTVNGKTEARYEQDVKRRVMDLNLRNSFIFTGALDDDRKWEAYGRADLFVLPTHSENFGIVVAEALYAGVPVITTKGTPWKELNTHGCGWWIDGGVESLILALQEAMALSREERAMMGARGRHLVETNYSWRAIAEKLRTEYELRSIVDVRLSNPSPI